MIFTIYITIYNEGFLDSKSLFLSIQVSLSVVHKEISLHDTVLEHGLLWDTNKPQVTTRFVSFRRLILVFQQAPPFLSYGGPPGQYNYSHCNLNSVENELHILFHCDLYNDLRKTIFIKINNRNTLFTNYNIHDKVCFLFNNTDSHISGLTADFVFQAKHN